MATCKKCGEFYITKKCMNCDNQENKEPLNERDKLYRVIRYAIIFFIGIFVIGSIAEIYIFNKVVDTTKPTIDNINQMTNTMNKVTEQMMNGINKEFNKINETMKKDVEKDNKEIGKIIQKYNEEQKIIKIEQKSKYIEPQKKYQRYTAAKLISDSKIEVMPDNRLKSNMPIYGRYIDRSVTIFECGKNEKVYKIVNECTGIVFPLDKIYFKESNKKDIQSYNKNTHMIECAYNQEHGIMHDCNLKLIGVR